MADFCQLLKLRGSHRSNVIFLMTMALASAAFCQDQAPIKYAWEDPSKIKTADTCRQCHTSEYEVWAKTEHAKGFKTLHRKKAAEEIAKNMGFDLIKRESLCLTCHYTPTMDDGTLRAVSGVSCESCHGASSDWINIHNNYGGKGFTFENETPEHKAQRIEECRTLGMRRPSDLYPVASRCFQCHTVPEEKLVNVGGHGTGSADFELVKWSQGEIRHNFFESFLHGDGTVNAERGPKRKRLMYALGRALDVEYSLRGLAVAEENKRYFKAMSRRLRIAVGEVRAIQSQINVGPMQEILNLVKSAKLQPGNKQELMAAAKAIGEQSKQFLDMYDGSELQALDPLISGEARAAPLVEDEIDTAPVEAPPSEVTSGVDAIRPEAPGPGETKLPAPQTLAAIPATGAKNAHLRPKSNFETLGPGKCSGCHRHETQSTWWFDDRHYRSADPFLAKDPKYLGIAKLYGLEPGTLTRGTSLCMDCHGTVISGKETREVLDGVGCEACHGPAVSYVEPHQEGNASEGLQRKGYLAAIKLGMISKADPVQRAKACASCHYITDERLLSSGHPSGEKFDYLKGLSSIKHWETPAVKESELKAAYLAEQKRRGPIPKVTLAREQVVQKQNPPSRDRETAKSELASLLRDPENKNVTSPSVPKPRPASAAKVQSSAIQKALGELVFEEIDSELPVEDILILLKQRLEKLHQSVQNAGDK